MTNTSALTADLDEQLLKDIVITAVEGGINYWAAVANYDPDEGRVLVYDQEEDDGEEHQVDLDTIRTAIAAVKSNPQIAPRFIGQVNQMLDADPELDFDADTADALLQIGLFGEVVYG
jgi:hypothetical protein